MTHFVLVYLFYNFSPGSNTRQSFVLDTHTGQRLDCEVIKFFLKEVSFGDVAVDIVVDGDLYNEKNTLYILLSIWTISKDSSSWRLI